MEPTSRTSLDEMAADCRRRSDAYHDRDVRRELLAMAAEYEARAEALRIQDGRSEAGTGDLVGGTRI